MSLYDQYNLAESTAIPRYQGSAIPELEQVAGQAQQRYETAQNYMDATEQAMAQTQASTYDQQELQRLNEEKKSRLQDFAKRGDLENLWRDTMLEARDYANKSKYFTDNISRIQGWQGKIDKMVEDGHLNPEDAKAFVAAGLDGYKGLQPDGTGKYTNQFTGPAAMRDVDIPKKLNEMLANAHPEVRGGEVKKDINGWYITNGTETKRLPMQEVMKIVNAGIDSDPEIMPWIRQQGKLAGYKAGIPTSVPDAVIMKYYQDKPNMLAAIQQEMGASKVGAAKALHNLLGTERQSKLMQDIRDYASKGVIDEQTSKHFEEMDPLEVERRKKEMDNKMIPMNYVGQNYGADIKSAGDYEDYMRANKQQADDLAAKYERFRSDPSRRFEQSTGKVYQMVDGKEEDVTPQANQLYSDLQKKLKENQDLENIRHAAAISSGYDPARAPKEVVREGEYRRNLYVQSAMQAAHEIRDPRTGAITGYRTPSDEEVKQIQEKANQLYSQTINDKAPRRKEYEEELMKRLNYGDEQSKIWGMPNDAMKQELGQMVTGLSSKLGLKKGMLSFQIGAGPDRGQQISADNYDDIMGKMEPVGITHSAKDGSTQIVFRANQDVQGKKTKGENMILTVPDAGWVDEYVQKRMAPDDRHEFYMDQALKSGLANATGTMKWENVTDKSGRQVPISIRRNRASNSGDNAFVVTVPGADGRPVQIPVNSYEGITRLIDNIQAEYHK